MVKTSSSVQAGRRQPLKQGNVILLPVVTQAAHRPDGQIQEARNDPPEQPLLFGNGELPDLPPWLVDEKPLPAARKGAAKKPRVSKAKAKTNKQVKTGAKTGAKTGVKTKVKPVARKTVKAKSGKSGPMRTSNPMGKRIELTSAPTGTIAPIAPASAPAPPSAIAAPSTPRSNAMVVWRKEGPIDILRYWLRSAGLGMVKMMQPKKPPRTAISEAAGARLRSRKALLRELAVLREENAMLREKLDLPPMPFGRQVVDRV